MFVGYMELTSPAPANDLLLSEFAAAHAGARIFVAGYPGGRILLSVSPGRHYVCFDGDMPGTLILDIYAEMKAAGLLNAPMSQLADYTRFSGVIDWGLIADLDHLKPWGEYPPSKVAFLMSKDDASYILKVTSVQFPNIEQKLFTTMFAALTWLGWD